MITDDEMLGLAKETLVMAINDLNEDDADEFESIVRYTKHLIDNGEVDFICQQLALNTLKQPIPDYVKSMILGRPN